LDEGWGRIEDIRENRNMINQIKEQLVKLEKDRNIKILLAVESGSRAWGIPSPDSDYDVRMIYIHTTDWYLSIGERKDSIDFFEGELLDISGWDIRKAFKLVRKSNATPMEWCRSPIIYHEEEGFVSELKQLTSSYFVPKHTINHYWGIAKNSFHSNYKDNKIILKKLFYVLRPLLAAKWIIKYNEIPPITLDELIVLVDDKIVKEKIENLISFKETAKERYTYVVEDDILKYVESLFDEIKNVNFPDSEMLMDDELNIKFRELLKRYENDHI
jgi:predicted nucleotidyltransferase